MTQISGKMKQQWGKLLNDDLIILQGKRTELVGRLQRKYGVEKKEAEMQIEDICKGSKVRLIFYLGYF